MSNADSMDAFSYNGGPTLYISTNRTPAVEDIRSIIIYISFATFFIAFLTIIPGVRKERLSTFICVTISLYVGGSILVTNFGTSWHVANASVSTPYRAFSKEKIFGDVGVYVGLNSVNITLRAKKELHEDINYNERFYWIGPTEMKQEYHNALAKGLPFPILTIAEYLSQDGEGFCWGRRYRAAGYYVSLLLWASFASWLLMNLLLCAVPRYGVYMMQATGSIMLLANALYAVLLPRKPLVIPFEGQKLTFVYGWCFWLVMAAGITAIVVGASVTIFDTLFPNKFSTILEVDYDTPYRYFVGNDAHLFGCEGLATEKHSCPHQKASAKSSTATNTTECNSNSVEQKSVLSKTKSDASTLTTTSMPVKKDIGGGSSIGIQSDPSVTSTTTSVMTSDNNETVSDGGVANQAFEHGEDSDGSDVSSTIIDGKRAISLHSFEKLASQQRRQPMPAPFVDNSTYDISSSAAMW